MEMNYPVQISSKKELIFAIFEFFVVEHWRISTDIEGIKNQ